MSANNTELIIRVNDNPIPNDCPLCNRATNPNIGAEIFLANADRVVCFDCALIHAPILASLITLQDAARFFQTHETGFCDRWNEANKIKRNPLNTYQSFGIQKEVS